MFKIEPGHMIKNALKSLLKRTGFEIRRSAADIGESPHAAFMRNKEVDCVFDIGANIGQSIGLFRSLNYFGPIHAFEPVSHLFQQLTQRAHSDGNCVAYRSAVGDLNGTVRINVSGGHGGASSVLFMTEQTAHLAPDQVPIRTEEVPICTLDWACREYYPKGDRLFVKLDVQGLEEQCIKSGESSLARVVGIKTEMSIVQNYLDEATMLDLIPLLDAHGFSPVFIEEGWRNPHSGELLQCDLWFQRRD